MRYKSRSILSVILLICLSFSLLTGCTEKISFETRQLVLEKTNKTLQLYADIERLAKDNNLPADASFTNMKKQLTDMSGKIKAGIDKTTEDDGQISIKQLDSLLDNLNKLKKKVEKSIGK